MRQGQPPIIDVRSILTKHYSPFLKWPQFVQRFVSWLLSRLIWQKTINDTMSEIGHLQPFDFIEAVFAELGFTYYFCPQDLENIPAKGGVIIYANHPLGGLDSLSLLHLVSLVRKDVQIVANQHLSNITPIAPLLLPVDNLKGDSRKHDLANITKALKAGRVVIIFPAGRVSRLSLRGIQDSAWDAGFLRFAERLNMPLMPIYIKTRNSALFYIIGRFSTLASFLLLPSEVFRFKGRLQFFTSPVITPEQFAPLPMTRNAKVQLLRKHLYQLPTKKPPVFTIKQSVIHPRDRQSLRHELATAEELATTSDGKRILLFTPPTDSAVLDELGRLREDAFRAVGEGTGRRKDTDRFDAYYRHIIVWDDDLLEIAGAYRLGEIWQWRQQDARRAAEAQQHDGPTHWKLYSSTLFEFENDPNSVIPDSLGAVMDTGLELGRSFVQPQFWGKHSLDYLWRGIGAYVARHPQVRYLFGPVSMSANIPTPARDMLIWYYQHYYKERELIAVPKPGFEIPASTRSEIESQMNGNDLEADYVILRQQFERLQLRIPTLFKQYADVAHYDAVSFSAFNIDPAFSMSLSSLVKVDLRGVKSSKFERYVECHLQHDAQED